MLLYGIKNKLYDVLIDSGAAKSVKATKMYESSIVDVVILSSTCWVGTLNMLSGIFDKVSNGP